MTRYLFLFLPLLLFTACSPSATGEEPGTGSSSNAETELQGQPTSIRAQLSNWTGGKIFLDHLSILGSFEVVHSDMPDAQGLYTANFGLKEPGVYRLRLGALPVLLLLEGGEEVVLKIDINGQSLDIDIQGSKLSQEAQRWESRPDAKDPKVLQAFYDNAQPEDALLTLYLVSKVNPGTEDGLAMLKKGQELIKTRYPDSQLYRSYSNVIAQIANQATGNAGKVAVGQPIPDIELPQPNGKNLALSSLKGQVVLIDFWAAWCRPCRMENPNVVNVYNKYKDKGFTVYSISLDGIDDRNANALSSNPQRLKQEQEKQKQNWLKAIEQDGLLWTNHVSDLRSWSCPFVQRFQVQGIPRTFLIDRKGILRYENLRGPELERRVKELIEG